MPHPIEQRIHLLRARVRRLVLVRGLSWAVGALVGSVIVVGAADYLIRFRDPGLRVICSLLVAAALVWACYRRLWLPLVARLGEVELALWLQRRFPVLGDRLVSSVEFMKQSEDDPIAGSAALRRAVIAQTTAEAEPLDFSDVLYRRVPIRAAVVAGSICLVAAILLGLAATREASAIAVVRLALPLRDTPWPQKNHLRLWREVHRVARGQAFEVEVVDRLQRRLPKDVSIHYRFEAPDGATTTETEPMQFVDGKAAVEGFSGDAAKLRGRGVMVARRDNVSRPFSYRIEGGDDSLMPWHAVEVVDPPGLESVRITLTPPAYTGWPATTPKGSLIRAIEGTRVQISARATRPLRSAVLHREDGWRIDAGPTDRSGQNVAAEFTIDHTDDGEAAVLLWAELIDREDLRGKTDWQFRVLADRPPTASIRQPSDTVFVTASGTVPLELTASDDLAIRKLALAFHLSAPADGDQPQEEESLLPLYTGAESVPAELAGGLPSGAEPGDRRDIQHRWELTDLGLTPGSEVTFRLIATDYRPQTAESPPRRLVVITPEDLQRRMADRQSLILAELARVLKMQQASRSQVRSLGIRLGEIGQLERLDIDRLQGAELNQRDVHSSLTDRTTGVPTLVFTLLADLDNNHLDSPDLRRRMQMILAEIDRLDRGPLTAIGRELNAAIKSAEIRLQRPATPEPSQPQDPVADALAEAGTNQDEVIASLEDLLDQLAEWDRYRRFHRQISELSGEQERLTNRSAAVGGRTLGKDPKDLLPVEAADLKILTQEQLDIARQLDRILQGMDRAAVELRQSDPLAADTLADAAAEARERAISGKMLLAGDRLRHNQIGQAATHQQQIARDLQEVLDILANRREHELARLIRKLAEAEDEAAQTQRHQAEFRRDMQAAAADPNAPRQQREIERLARQQADLQQQTQRQARQLDRLQAEQPAATMRQAAGQMGQAAQAAAQGNAQGAAREAAATQESLEQARQELAQQRRQAEAELAAEQLARLEDNVKHLRRRQENLLEETQRFARLQAAGELTRPQTASLADAARQQASLATETRQLGEGLSGAGAFRLTLSRAAGLMGEAAALLGRRQTGPPTQDAERQALGRIDLLLEALEKEPPSDESGSGGGGGGAGQGGNPGTVRMLAELKLLRLLQEEVNLRTAQLEETISAGEELTQQQQREYAALREEQGRLADLTWELVQAAQPNPEDNPAGLPIWQPDAAEAEDMLPNEGETP